MSKVDLIAWSSLIGALLPVLVSLIKKSSWSMTQKQAVVIVLSLVAAVVNVGVDQGWTSISIDMVVASMTTIFVVAQMTYDKLWSSSSINERLERLGN